MSSKWITSLVSGVTLIAVTLSSALPAPAEQAPDKNGPGVTRVSIVQGSVVIQRGDGNKQVTAVVNAPLLPGDYISTAGTSRGELQFDGSTAVRLGGNVQARITNDDPNNRQLQLADGTIEVGLVRNSGTVAIDTPSLTIRTDQAGDYRISIGRDGSSWVTTRRGSAEVVTPQRTYALESGRTLVARGSASNPSITYTSEIGYDAFDDFNAKRDQTMVAALDASPNLNPDIAGYDNLGAYGQWQDVSGYGQVWVPDQSSNWAPYANGSWTWEGGYGWTWVASEPWGWAPYHYGRWFYANGYGWAWYPPAYNAYPAWSPAYVGFFGFGVGGPGWGVSLGFGYPYLGWYPLAPYAPYYPWWPGWAWTGWGWGWGGWGCCGYGWGNVVHVTNITNIYRNFPHGGVHGTLVGNLTHGTVSGHIVPVTAHSIGGHIGLVHGAVPVTPTRGSLGFGGRPVSAPVTLSKAFDSPRFASADRSLGHTSFDEQQHAVSRAIESNTHNNAPVSSENERGSVTGDRGTVNGERASSDSWQRFGQDRVNEARNSEERGSNSIASHSERAEPSSVRASDPWSRFSQERGNVSGSAYDRAASSRSESYSRDSYGSSYGRNSYGSAYGRNPYQSSSYERGNSYERSNSYSRNPYATPYSRGSYGSYPSYSRGSYGSYPSYSRGSYGSYPSYSRGSSPSYSHGAEPSYSHGAASAPHPSGGGGGGGEHGGGGGRPPH